MPRFAVVALSLTACGDAPKDDARQSAATPDAASPPTCEDLLTIDTPDAAPHFVDDVMPVFGLSCNFDSCHRGIGTGGFPRFGPRCAYDEATGACDFEPGALSPDVLDSIQVALLGPSRRGVLPRVAPGDPLASFLALKVADCHEAFPDTTRCVNGCGDEMPPNEALAGRARERFDVLIGWIASGAPF